MPDYNRSLPQHNGEPKTVKGHFARHYRHEGAAFPLAETLTMGNRAEGTRSVYIKTRSGNTYYLDIFNGLIVSLQESQKRGQIITRTLGRIDPEITCGRGFTFVALELDAGGIPTHGVHAHTSPVEEIVAIEDGPSATFGIAPEEFEEEIPFVREFDEACGYLLPDRAEWV